MGTESLVGEMGREGSVGKKNNRSAWLGEKASKNKGNSWPRGIFFPVTLKDCWLLQWSGLNKQEHRRPWNPAAIPPDKRIRTLASHPRSKATSFSSIQSQLQ